MTAEDGKLGNSGKIFFVNTLKFVGICFPGNKQFPLFLRLGQCRTLRRGVD
jgi:hypothetical protein